MCKSTNRMKKPNKGKNAETFTSAGVWKVTKRNPDTKYVQVESDQSTSLWCPEQWVNDLARLENYRVSKNYFRSERDRLMSQVVNLEQAAKGENWEIEVANRRAGMWKTISVALFLFIVVMAIVVKNVL